METVMVVWELYRKSITGEASNRLSQVKSLFLVLPRSSYKPLVSHNPSPPNPFLNSCSAAAYGGSLSRRILSLVRRPPVSGVCLASYDVKLSNEWNHFKKGWPSSILHFYKGILDPRQLLTPNLDDPILIAQLVGRWPFCTQGCGFDPVPSRWIFMLQKFDSGHVV
ncbi:hypothetical protein TNCV_4108791 [Trichonephila clavipes]|nr:hypothetical protein TNCV_4108791 [Trichonephila clavipes]